MFETLCRKNGVLKIPTGIYHDSAPEYEERPVVYFAMDKNFCDEQGRMQVLTQYFCKGYDAPAPSGSVLITEDGEQIDVMAVEYLYNHFEDKEEFNVLTAAHK